MVAVSARQEGASEGSKDGGGRHQSTVVWLKLLASSIESVMGFHADCVGLSRDGS